MESESLLDRPEPKDRETKDSELEDARNARQEALGREPVDSVAEARQARQERLGRVETKKAKPKAKKEEKTEEPTE